MACSSPCMQRCRRFNAPFSEHHNRFPVPGFHLSAIRMWKTDSDQELLMGHVKNHKPMVVERLVKRNE